MQFIKSRKGNGRDKELFGNAFEDEEMLLITSKVMLRIILDREV